MGSLAMFYHAGCSTRIRGWNTYLPCLILEDKPSCTSHNCQLMGSNMLTFSLPIINIIVMTLKKQEFWGNSSLSTLRWIHQSICPFHLLHGPSTICQKCNPKSTKIWKFFRSSESKKTFLLTPIPQLFSIRIRRWCFFWRFHIVRNQFIENFQDLCT